MTGISTHVLDTARGIPTKGMPVRLERQESHEQWRTIGSSHTDQDGRCRQLLADGEQLSPGTYRLVFDTATYHSSQGVEALYPFVNIIFTVRKGETWFHLPLLLNPYGYTTYRGS